MFVPATAFAVRMPAKLLHPVCGLDYPFTISLMIRALGAARLVSTPSRPELRRAWLGIATMRRFPRIWAVLHRQFLGEHSSVAQVRCVCHSATPAWSSDCLSIIGQVQLDLHQSPSQEAAAVKRAPSKPAFFAFLLFFGRMTFIAAASREVLICDA